RSPPRSCACADLPCVGLASVFAAGRGSLERDGVRRKNHQTSVAASATPTRASTGLRIAAQYGPDHGHSGSFTLIVQRRCSAIEPVTTYEGIQMAFRPFLLAAAVLPMSLV